MQRPRCRFLKHHPGGSWSAVAEGGDDPHNYDYCLKLGWSGADEEPEDGVNICDTCEFYKPEGK